RDVTGDGVDDVLVGSPLQDAGGKRGQGRVFLFSGADGALAATLADPSPQAMARFGFAASLVRDVNGDGKADVLVGAPDQDVAGIVNAGQAFLFSGHGGSVL